MTQIKIPQHITTIPEKLFNLCISLKKITIPDSVIEISTSGFACCSSLEEVVFGPNSKLKKILQNAFIECSSLEKLNLPQSLEYIGNSAFEKCTFLSSVIIGSSNKLVLGQRCFYSCSNLREILFTSSSVNLANIPDYTFYNCYLLEKINIPKTAGFIGYSAFYSCITLHKIVIPSSVEIIYRYAFYNCSKLEEFEFEESSSLQIIECEVFEMCDKLTKIVLPASLVEFKGDLSIYKFEQITIHSNQLHLLDLFDPSIKVFLI